MPKNSNRSTTQYEKMGRELESLYDAVNPDRKRLYRTAFIKGMVSGVGGVIGATIIIALIIGILSWLGHVLHLGPYVDNLKHTIQKPPTK